MAPPPADPPSVEELEAADIPEPPAIAEPAFAATTEPSLEVPEPEDVVTPSAAGEILAAGAAETPHVFTPAAEPEGQSIG